MPFCIVIDYYIIMQCHFLFCSLSNKPLFYSGTFNPPSLMILIHTYEFDGKANAIVAEVVLGGRDKLATATEEIDKHNDCAPERLVVVIDDDW